MGKIGIVGGTFDPIHCGHLLIGNEVKEALSLDEIWYMPNKVPPHKKEKKLTSTENRLRMIELAIASNKDFALAIDELEREGVSYTYDTMKMLREKYPHHTFYFIIGGDMVEYLPKWYRVDELLQFVQFVGVTRPGYTVKSPYSIITLEIPEFSVSSSLIRDRIKNRKSIRYLVPTNIQHYIEENGLYE
ncbi:nicotinate-nucleotide adenylyltransferase [Priestia taiwanensis]|uniref:Probable nicotinate-nucleotide adenylyltransferase n=1 Tax=Priestia taiwanensis TaxID=1347902 RepID=A0A917EQB2_9BACI|nr:nicotinate-nucleotide adenylyltransferase [Priestia taiwanensis]MBM7363708.1 nicotinate-nucleotide adenylyltransferase [Priestia taiwanensis]GGE74769.1 putative nicotinate-nucleotide adenylyltransferase [Priestia taiwanensis]